MAKPLGVFFSGTARGFRMAMAKPLGVMEAGLTENVRVTTQPGAPR